jgi:predicted dehydrogenase
MVRWGIMSTGTIARNFADVLNKMSGEGVAVLGRVASRNIEKAKAFAEELNVPAYYGSYEALAAAPDIDAVYVATPNNFHFENVCLCLDAGKHVLCEKPFTINAAQARELYVRARVKKLFLMDGLWIVHLPVLKKLKELLAEGIIGEVQHIRADYGFTATGARKDRKFNSDLGGGALLDVGVYNICFAHFVMNAMPTTIKSYLRINEYGTDDFGAVVLEYPGSRSAVLTSSIGVTMPTEGVVYGTKGRIYLPNYQRAQSMTVYTDSGKPLEISIPFEINGFEYQIREAGRCIENGMLTSSQLTEDFSVGVMQTLDDIRSQCGLQFSFEK